jgi:hypothetical protein
VFFQFGIKVCEIDVALVVASDRNNSKTNEDGAGGVGSVRGDGNQADISLGVPTGLMPSPDREKACVFALRTRIGLQGNMWKPGDFTQPIL